MTVNTYLKSAPVRSTGHSPEEEPPRKQLHIAFNAIEGSGWTGGINYIRNLITSLRTGVTGNETPYISLVVSHGSMEASYNSIRPLIDNVIYAPNSAAPSKTIRALRLIGRSINKEWGTQEHPLNNLLREGGVDVMFSMTVFGPRFATPLMAWIYDFQHLYLPNMFTQDELNGRNAGFRDAAKYASQVILSSEHAKQDFEQFAPEAASKARVLSFVAQVSDDVWEGDPSWVCEHYHIPDRFFYLPNQFWKHKNHHVVLEALKISKQRGQKLTVVCTGNTSDYRNPSYFAEFLSEISRSGLRDQFLILGLVPHAHTFQLLRQSTAVLQPSLFEGWSTTVEEVKSIGKPIILSDFAVHKEQAPPQATFFNGNSPEQLATSLEEATQRFSSGSNTNMEAKARLEFPRRNAAFARMFLQVAHEAASSNSIQ